MPEEKTKIDTILNYATTGLAGVLLGVLGGFLITNDSYKQRIEEYEKTLQKLKPIYSAKLPENPGIYFDPSTVWYEKSWCTGSMEPTIGCSDTLILYKPDVNDVKPDDIIVYKIKDKRCGSEGSRILHRVKRVISGKDGVVRFELRGDANSANDDCQIPYSWIEGKILAIIKDSIVK